MTECACGVKLSKPTNKRCRACDTEHRQRIDPALIPVIREGVASGLSARALGKQLGLNRASLITFVLRNALGPWKTQHGPAGSTIPDHFEAFYRTHTGKETAAHYNVSEGTVVRWAQTKGIRRDRPKAQPKPRASRVLKPGKPAGPSATPNAIKRDYSVAGQAADFLRKFGPVKRCDAARSYDENGDHWLRGGFLLTAEDVVARATRLGFRVAL